MAFFQIPNVHIKGISACVPKNKIANIKLTSLLTEPELKKIIDTVGIEERRFVEDSTTAADLCYAAAEKLIEDMGIDKNSIDVLLFVSQTADYKIPTTSSILQHKLQLPTNTMAMDINMACSGFVYGLSTASAYLNLPNINKVLLLVGDTLSKLINQKDKTNTLLFGDAGAATILEKKEGENMIFELQTDGKNWNSIMIKDGGARNKLTNQSTIEYIREDESIGTDSQLYMNGLDVFNFTMSVVPKSIKSILSQANKNLDEIDQIVFHQANRFMTNFFAKKLKYPKEKVPYSLDKFGNTSSVSIPLTIVSELKNWQSTKKDMIICGFGSGLSWGSAIINIENTYISDLIEI